jgi:hypothetical protein
VFKFIRRICSTHRNELDEVIDYYRKQDTNIKIPTTITKEYVLSVITKISGIENAPLETHDISGGFKVKVGMSTDSWSGYRTAEKIYDNKAIKFAQEIIESSSNKKIREAGYDFICKVARNTKSSTALEWMISRLEVEKRSTKDLMLRGIYMASEYGKIHITKGIDVLLALLKSEEKLITQTTQVLGLINKDKPKVEKILCDLMKRRKECYSYPLSKIGSKYCVPYLIDSLEYTKGDRAGGVIYALKEVDGKNQGAFFIEFFRESSYRYLKEKALEAMLEYSDNSAVDIVSKRVKTIVKGKTPKGYHPTKSNMPHLGVAIKYLEKHDSKEAEKVLEIIRNNSRNISSDSKLYFIENYEFDKAILSKNEVRNYK